MYKIVNAKAVCRTFGDGQKVIAALLETDRIVEESEAVQEDFEITGRTITGVFVNESGNAQERAKRGNYIVVTLSADEPEAATRYMIGKGRDARTGIRRPVLEIRHVPTKERIESSEVMDALADQFTQFRYQVLESEHFLDYQLYVPKHLEDGEKYPLVLFMHDMGACSDDPLAPLAQGLGALTWVEKENQEKRPCFVVAPCYPRKTANDEYQVTWEADGTVELVRALCEKYPVDTARIYGTGQSMGCMMLCELNLKYPEVFAGSFLVAGQWNPERMGAVKNQNLWILVSEKDEKAFPIMGACMESVEKNGGKVVRGHINAKDPLEKQEKEIRMIRETDGSIFFTWFEGESVLPEGTPAFPGAFHINTWVHAYSLEGVQEWLFSCKK